MVSQNVPTVILFLLGTLVSLSAQVLDIGSRRELFVDRFLIDRLTNARLELHPPQPAEVAIEIERPWEGPSNLGISVFYDEGIYRMYYRVYASRQIKGRCYAESRDGIHWSRPNLGLVSVAGTWENNAIVTRWRRNDPWAVKYTEKQDFWEGNPAAKSQDIRIIGMTPFLDRKPGVPHSQRWKGLTAKSSNRGRTRNLFLNRSQKMPCS